MGQTLRKLDIMAIAASGEATTLLRNFLLNLREDCAEAIGGTTAIFHKGVVNNSLSKSADPTDLPTSLVVANSLKVLFNDHFASTGTNGAHAAASAETIAADDATDQSTAETLADELKADFNTHLTESGVHLNNDTNTVATANATDLATLIALLTALIAAYNVHIVAAMSTPWIE